MQYFWRQTGLPTVLLLSGLSISLPAAAAPPTKERLPLTLNGPGCDSKQETINKILQEIPGVTSVDFNRVPGHVLVDITPSAVKSEDVINRVNNAATSWQCKVEFIQGCISAGMPSAAAAPHQHE
jgi:copper chaperone CopZ